MVIHHQVFDSLDNVLSYLNENFPLWEIDMIDDINNIVHIVSDEIKLRIYDDKVLAIDLTEVNP